LKRLDPEDLIKACKAGKRKYQEKLFRLYSEELFGLCLYYSRDQADAEDTLHEGFIKIFKNIKQYSFQGSFEGWMRRIMVNTALEKYRKGQHLQLLEEYPELNADAFDENAFSKLAAKDLLKMVQDLSPKYRMVFNLYAIEGYSHKEISEMLGISIGTSKSNLARARAVLQEKVKNYYEQKNYKVNK